MSRALNWALALALAASACAGGEAEVRQAAGAAGAGDELLIVDCLLPGQVRKLGAQVTYLTARRPAKTTAADCEIRGGEYVAYDRADLATALKVWIDAASSGDPVAETYVGEIYERGVGGAPDYALAAAWYRKAAERGFARAAINLGSLYERGLGVPRDAAEAFVWYRRAGGGPETDPAELARLRAEARRREAEAERLRAELAEAEAALAKAARPEEVKRLQAALAERTRRLAALEAKAAEPPSIEIVEPSLYATRGVRPRAPRPADPGAREIVGRVLAPAGLASLTVNGAKARPDAQGLFRRLLRVEGGETPVRVEAVDARGKRAAVAFVLGPEGARRAPEPAAAAPSRPEGGRDYALVIGEDDYRRLPRLEAAVRDAEAIASLLRERYGFRVALLKNATRYETLSALNALREQLGEQDRLILYYAGHGELDRVNMRGHWLPVDAEPGSDANWISNVAVTDILNAMPARQVLVIADSCYSGAMTLAASALGEAGGDKRSRTVLASGGLRPVLDAGGAGHSLFAEALLEVLGGAPGPLSGRALYEAVAARVVWAASAAGFEQTPAYAPIRFAGHEAGDFVLAPREAS